MNVINLEIKGKTITCQFGLLTIRHYCEDQDVAFSQMHNHVMMKAPFSFTDMAYFGYLTYCNLNGNEVQLKRNEFTEFGEVMTEKEANSIMEAVLDVKMMGQSFKERAEKAAEDEKKNP